MELSVLPQSISPPKRWFALFVVSLLSATAFIVGWRFHSQIHRVSAHVRVHSALPTLSVVDNTGKWIDLAQQGKGHKRVIAFFNSDCHICETTLPELKPFPKELTLQMVSEHDFSGIPIRELALLPDEFYFDRDNVLGTAVPLASLPTILFVDEKGIVQDASVGLHSRESLQAKLQLFLQAGS